MKEMELTSADGNKEDEVIRVSNDDLRTDSNIPIFMTINMQYKILTEV